MQTQPLDAQSSITPFWDNCIPVIPMKGRMMHTQAYPFCFGDPGCPCHRDPELLAEVQRAVHEGLLTEEEATFFIQGSTI